MAFSQDIDWRALTSKALDCPLPQTGSPSSEADMADYLAWPYTSLSADVSGDGVAEVLISSTCWVPTTGTPQRTVVYDLSSGTPQVIGVLGGKYAFASAEVSVQGRQVSLQGPSVAGDDPLCCASHHAEVSYEWDGQRFDLTQSSETAD